MCPKAMYKHIIEQLRVDLKAIQNGHLTQTSSLLKQDWFWKIWVVGTFSILTGISFQKAGAAFLVTRDLFMLKEII